MKELEDYEWFPHVLRQYQTEFIGDVVARFKFYDSLIQHLKNEKQHPEIMFDLCSGSGEPAVTIFKQSNLFKRLILSDKFPQRLIYNTPNIDYLNESKDALNTMFQKDNLYTMFNAFHHFNTIQKQRLVEQFIANNSKAYLVEILSPNVLTYFKVLFATTIGTIILTPFIQPFSLKRLIFTYLIPINILTITFDGMVSVFKSKSLKGYEKMFENYIEHVKVFRLRKGISSLIIIQIN